MDKLKDIFDSATKRTIDSTYTWFGYPTEPEYPGKGDENKKPKTIGDRIIDAAKDIDPYKSMQDYNQTVQFFLQQKARLPGRVETGGMSMPKSSGQISSMPGATRGLRTEGFTEKLEEIRARMRKFATDRYYVDSANIK